MTIGMTREIRRKKKNCKILLYKKTDMTPPPHPHRIVSSLPALADTLGDFLTPPPLY